MKSEDAKAIFLLEYCAERCDGYQNDDTCKNCEINAAIEALDKQIPKKPIVNSGEPLNIFRKYICSACGARVGEQRYCIQCGQAVYQEVEK